MKLGLAVKNGTATVVDAESGEEVEGVRYVAVESGMEKMTIAVVELVLYDKDGNEARG